MWSVYGAISACEFDVKWGGFVAVCAVRVCASFLTNCEYWLLLFIFYFIIYFLYFINLRVG